MKTDELTRSVPEVVSGVAPRRRDKPEQTVTIEVDGKSVEAVPGEPLAVALAASGRVLLGRSVKYHRPRGAFCYRGRCDGCLVF